MARKKAEKPPDPDRLVRGEGAGHYRSEDGRFEVSQEAAGTWYVTDNERTDELGLARVNGPYPTLAAVRAAIPTIRNAPERVVSLDEHKRSRKADAKEEPERPREKPAPPPPPPTWLDRLEGEEAARARKLIRAVERAGLPDAERLVRVDLEGIGPRLAPAVLLRRAWQDAVLSWDADAVADAARDGKLALPEETAAAAEALQELGDDAVAAVARVVARETARRVLDLVTSGEGAAAGLPRWTLDELDETGDRTGRRIGLSGDDLDAAARGE